jgi:hypothetical protein
MAKYFNFFPTTPYSNSDESMAYDIVTNIIARFAFEDGLKQNSSLFYPYNIQDGDTPEMIASKYYGSPEKHWIVLLFNNIIDPQYDWPLDQRTIIKYINNKYSASEYADTANTNISGLTWSMNANNVYAYYKTVTRVGTTDASLVTIKETIQVDANTYANVITSISNTTLQSGTVVSEITTKQKQTYYDYEIDTNESKREIKLLRAEYVTEKGLMNEFKRVISG